MKLRIIAVGKLKEKYFKEAVSEYSKRLSRFVSIEIVEIPDEKIPENCSDKQSEQIKNKEGSAILAKLPQDSYVVAMCIEGIQTSSEELAERLSGISMHHSSVTFIIGGSLGLADAVKSRADIQLSFGKITLPHQLMRIVLAEQLYRACKINANERYHK